MSILFFVGAGVVAFVALALLVLSIIVNILHTKKEHPIFILGAAFGVLLPILYLFSPMFTNTLGMLLTSYVELSELAALEETTFMMLLGTAIPRLLMLVSTAASLVIPSALFMTSGFMLKEKKNTKRDNDWMLKIAFVNIAFIIAVALLWKVSPYEVGETIVEFNENFSQFLKYSVPAFEGPVGFAVFNLESQIPFFVFGYALLSFGCCLVYPIAKKRDYTMIFFFLGGFITLVSAIAFLAFGNYELPFEMKEQVNGHSTNGLIYQFLEFIPEIVTWVRDVLVNAVNSINDALPALSVVWNFLSDTINNFLEPFISYPFLDLMSAKSFGFLYEICTLVSVALPGTFGFLLGYVANNKAMEKRGLKIVLLITATIIVAIFFGVLGFLVNTEFVSVLAEAAI